MERLAIEGGKPVLEYSLERYNTIGEEEIEAANRVLQSKVLSDFTGTSGDSFLGGIEVRSLEEEAAKRFGSSYAVSVNSWTSGLIAAVGAIGIEPGDEVIVTPWTMVATATAILQWNAIPVFCDIDEESYNIDTDKIEALISEKTKAIIYADIFGKGADVIGLRRIADRHGLKLIGDSAQAPAASVEGHYVSSYPDIGGYSLNYHKHIHCGEGGILLTNNKKYAERLRLIRNHGEAVIDSDSSEELSNILGYNFRLGEIEAAIAREQLKKMDELVEGRRQVAKRMLQELTDLPGLQLPTDIEGSVHSYYVLGMRLDTSRLKKDRSWIVRALRAEGVPSLYEGYQCLHLIPMFRNRIAYGNKGFPWVGLENRASKRRYERGLCPIAERLHEETFMGIGVCNYTFEERDVELIGSAFRKVWGDIVI